MEDITAREREIVSEWIRAAYWWYRSCGSGNGLSDEEHALADKLGISQVYRPTAIPVSTNSWACTLIDAGNVSLEVNFDGQA